METTFKVGGQDSTIRGAVVDGEFKLGTAFVKQVFTGGHIERIGPR